MNNYLGGVLSGPRASINLSSSGDHTVITGITDQVVTIYKLVIWAQAAVTVILKDGATAINGAGFNFAAQTGFTYDANTNPIILTPGNDFIISLGTDVAVTGFVLYALHDAV